MHFIQLMVNGNTFDIGLTQKYPSLRGRFARSNLTERRNTNRDTKFCVPTSPQSGLAMTMPYSNPNSNFLFVISRGYGTLFSAGSLHGPCPMLPPFPRTRIHTFCPGVKPLITVLLCLEISCFIMVLPGLAASEYT